MKQATLTALFAIASMASWGQDAWAVTILRSEGFSQGFAALGNDQFGWADTKACSWSGTAESFTNWQQFSDERSFITCRFGAVSGGVFALNSDDNAAIWVGGPTGLQILEPFADVTSGVNDIDADGPVGSMVQGGKLGQHLHAILWRNLTERIDLHPAGALYSIARAAAPGLQGGEFGPNGSSTTIHACLWRGTPESIVDLSPTAHTARVAGADGEIQAGELDAHACIWRGTPESLVDMHPAGATRSLCLDARSVYQVGFAAFKGNNHAAIWSGSKASFIDLHKALPKGYVFSQADAVSTALIPEPNRRTYTYRIDVVGSAVPEKGRFDGRTDTILWRLEGKLEVPGQGQLPPRVTRRIRIGKLGKLKFVIDFSKPIRTPVPRWAR